MADPILEMAGRMKLFRIALYKPWLYYSLYLNIKSLSRQNVPGDISLLPTSFSLGTGGGAGDEELFTRLSYSTPADNKYY